jgi:hypothetical protein
MFTATKIIEEHLGLVKNDLKKNRNIFQVIKERDLAIILINNRSRPPIM